MFFVTLITVSISSPAMPFAFRRQPLSTIYILGAVVYSLATLPIWLVLDVLPFTRPRRSWPIKRALFARAARFWLHVMWQTSLPAPTPLSKFEQDGKALGFVRVNAAPELVVGEFLELAKQNGVEAKDIGGFWYGPRDSNGDVGQRASPKDRVVYYFHGASLDAPSNERTMLKTLIDQAGVML